MYKIVIDSCGELPEELKQDGHYETVSLELEVDGCRIRDDSTFDQSDFLRRVRESLKGPKSSCPSPEQYMDAYEGEADHVYAVTLSGGLSGSYNSAVLGKNLYATAVSSVGCDSATGSFLAVSMRWFCSRI